MNYSSYLFNSLLSCHNKSFDRLPYDLQYHAHTDLHKEFECSEFNVDTKSEYDCMNEFLENKNVSTIIY